MKKLLIILSFSFIFLVPLCITGCYLGSHTCKYYENYSADIDYHWFDSKCHNEEQYRLNKEKHTYSELQAVSGGGFAISCTVCGYIQETPTKNYFIAEVENGSVEVITESSGRTVLLPKPNDGYYFSHWQTSFETIKTKDDEFSDFYAGTSYEQIQTVKPFTIDEVDINIAGVSVSVEKFKPVFINYKDGLIDVEVNVYSDLEEDVDIWYLPYCHDNKYFSYYIKESENVMVEKEERVTSSVTNNTSYDIPAYLPYVGNVESRNTNKLKGVNIYLKDVTNKAIVNVVSNFGGKDEDSRYVIANEGEDIVLESELQKYARFLFCWKDENGEILTYDKKPIVKAENGKKYTAVYECSVVSTGNTTYYSYANSEGTELLLEVVSSITGESFIVPDEVANIPVVGIADYAFNDCSTFKNVVIPETVTYFGKHAFDNIRGSYLNYTIEFLGDSKRNISLSQFYDLPSNVQVDINMLTLDWAIKKSIYEIHNMSINIQYEAPGYLGEGVNCEFNPSTATLIVCIDHNKITSGSSAGEIDYTSRCELNIQFLKDFAYELRLMYQDIALGNINGISIDNLNDKPTEEQIESWSDMANRILDAENYLEDLFN